MQQTVAERAVRDIVVELGVELVKAVPAELVLALAALHELAALLPHYIDLTRGAHLRATQFVQVAEKRVFLPVELLEVR